MHRRRAEERLPRGHEGSQAKHPQADEQEETKAMGSMEEAGNHARAPPRDQVQEDPGCSSTQGQKRPRRRQEE